MATMTAVEADNVATVVAEAVFIFLAWMIDVCDVCACWNVLSLKQS